MRILYKRMRQGCGLFSSAAGSFGCPNEFTLQSLFKGAAIAKSLRRTSQLHGLLLKLGLGSRQFLLNGLLRSYCACGSIHRARHLFDHMPQRDTVSFNTMLHGHVAAGDLDSAAKLFSQIPHRSPISWTTMLVGFSAAGDLSVARHLFDEMPPPKDIVSWNAMLSSYVQNHRPLEALQLFLQLLAAGFPAPNQTTLAGALSACAGAGALAAGHCLHALLIKKGFLLDAFLGSSLLHMYSKCGLPESALQIFHSLTEQNVYTWNAVINGLAVNGMAELALKLFQRMRLEPGIAPDGVTFVGVLRACGHGGFLEEGRRHFHSTMAAYGVRPSVEHFACMVDLLARSGRLREAERLIAGMPVAPDAVVWRALLGGCRLHRDAATAERAVAGISACGAACGADFVLLSNTYAAVGRWAEAARVRKSIGKTGSNKIPGWSYIDHESTVNDSQL